MAARKITIEHPVWTFIGTLAGVASVVLALVIYVKPDPFAAGPSPTPRTPARPAGPSADNALLAHYSAETPGPGCDKGGAQWTLQSGKVTCTNQRAVYRAASASKDAFVRVDWPGRTLAPAYEITLYADVLDPSTCINIVVRYGYGLGTCAYGGVEIARLRSSEPIALASKPTRRFTNVQIMARIEGQKITLMVFANNDEGEIMLTATDDAFGSANWLAIDVVSDHAESAMAELYDFQYRPMS